MMIVAGVTGGIGTGKSTFCKVWEDLGAYVLYADDYARQLMETDAELISEIKKTFGNNAYSKTGRLNRKYLAREAFEKHRVAELNALVHPVFNERVRTLISEKSAENYPVFLEESALLLKDGRPAIMDYVILLKASGKEQIERASGRDGTDSSAVRARMEKQPNYEQFEPLCDYIVENTGSVSRLQKRAKEIFEEITAKH